jgi:hypothetical protein
VARTIGTPKFASGSARGRLLALVPLVFGALCTLGWLGLLIGLFAGMNVEDTALGLTIALLVLVTLAGLSTLCVRCTGTIVAIVSAVLFAGVWTYLRIGFDPLMPDVMLLTLTAIFFLTPLVTGVTALAVGVRARR